jgi:hypothetical protein
MKLSNRRTFLKIGSIGVALPFAIPFYNSLTQKKPLKNIVFLSMNGGFSQLESFDYKEKLFSHAGKSMFVAENEDQSSIIMPPHVKFKQYGESGAWVSDSFPHMSKIVDDLAFIKSCKTFSPLHFLAMSYLYTGSNLAGGTSIMSWLEYIYSRYEKKSILPNTVTLFDPIRGLSRFGIESTLSGEIPRRFEGNILDVNIKELDLLRTLNSKETMSVKEILAVTKKLNQYQNKYLYEDFLIKSDSLVKSLDIQSELLKVLNFDNISEATRTIYGLKNKKTQNVGRQLLTAKRLLESGVKVVNVNVGGADEKISWDSHNEYDTFDGLAESVDLPIAGFMQDMKRSGLLDETLVVFWTEFGRLPVRQSALPKGEAQGRDHNPNAFTIWMAGAGINVGQSIGETDELGYRIAKEPYSVHDIHRTILEIAGINPHDLSYSKESKKIDFFKTTPNLIKGLI